MKLSLAIASLALAIPVASFAQDSTAATDGKYPNTFSSGSANVSPFNNQAKRFNDWSISAGVGVPLIQSADLTSIKNGNAFCRPSKRTIRTTPPPPGSKPKVTSGKPNLVFASRIAIR